jgi:hypothetical protein
MNTSAKYYNAIFHFFAYLRFQPNLHNTPRASPMSVARVITTICNYLKLALRRACPTVTGWRANCSCQYLSRQ